MSEDAFKWVVSGGVAIAAACILVQAVAIVALYAVIRKIQLKLNGFLESAEPLVGSVRGIVDDIKPKIGSISADAVDIAKIGKQQAGRIGELVQDFSERAKIQVSRIDGKVDETVDQVQAATVAAKDVFMKPVREVDGIFSGLRAAMAVYARPRKSSVDHATQDEEMFI